MHPKEKRLFCALVAAGLVSAAACSAKHFEDVERPPRAPEGPAPFAMDDVRAAMWQLASRTEKINVIVRRSAGNPDATDASSIIALLGEMDAIADRLAASDARAVHPVLGLHIEEFQRDVRIARRHASAEPPNFFMAATIAGACMNCHGEGFGRLGVTP